MKKKFSKRLENLGIQAEGTTSIDIAFLPIPTEGTCNASVISVDDVYPRNVAIGCRSEHRFRFTFVFEDHHKDGVTINHYILCVRSGFGAASPLKYSVYISVKKKNFLVVSDFLENPMVNVSLPAGKKKYNYKWFYMVRATDANGAYVDTHGYVVVPKPDVTTALLAGEETLLAEVRSFLFQHFPGYSRYTNHILPFQKACQHMYCKGIDTTRARTHKNTNTETQNEREAKTKAIRTC